MTRPRGDFYLALSAWVLAHQTTLRRAGNTLVVLVAFSVLAWSGAQVWTITTQAAASTKDVRSAVTDVGHMLHVLPAAPQAISAGDVAIIRRDTSHADLLVTITNPNADWLAAQVTLHVAADGVASDAVTTFLNPAATRSIIQRNVTWPENATNASVVLSGNSWIRRASLIPAPSFTIDQLTLTPTTYPAVTGRVPSVLLTALVTNHSVYGFHAVTVPIVLTSGSTPVGVDELTLSDWGPLQTKTITLTWPYAVARADSATIDPQVDRSDLGNTYR